MGYYRHEEPADRVEDVVICGGLIAHLSAGKHQGSVA